jgi:hypothetical protein
MALIPIDEVHALQIQAGTLGRNAGHKFEDSITKKINEFTYPYRVPQCIEEHIFVGDPGLLLLEYIGNRMGLTEIAHASAISTGALATSEAGKRWLSVNGVGVTRCKSDLVITIKDSSNKESTVGVSTKQCNNKNPTNAQLYFTTARGFATLLQNNGMPVSQIAIDSLRQFCGDAGFRPSDNPSILESRKSDPRRFFWEEIDPTGRKEWESILSNKQDEVARLLFQKAYLHDPFVPEFLLHKTKRADSWEKTEVAIYTISELIFLSRLYQGYATKPYSVKKGSHKDPLGVTHLAPRFGVIQMQRGGQAQHPEQLQFNLEASYFYKLPKIRK